MKRHTIYIAFLAAAILFAFPSLSNAGRLSNGTAWVSRSAEYPCCVEQAYLNASKRLRELARGEKKTAWCVVADADETILSNAAFEVEKETKNIRHSGKVWEAWCKKAKATALPGAKEFLTLARGLGGKVIIITNRSGSVGGATLKNLDALKIPYDACLFREGPYASDREKTERRADVEKGKIKTLPAGRSLPPMKILMLVGDQAHDLYDPSKSDFKEVRKRFGKDLVIIPNPVYGDFLKATSAE